MIQTMKTQLTKRKTASDLYLSFESFKKKLNDSENYAIDNMASEDPMKMGSNFRNTNENDKLHNNKGTLKQVSVDIKLIWLQSALNFIKNDNQLILTFPTISVEETDFIEAILNQGCEPDLDARFDTLYLSIKEALTIYKPKYLFSLNTVFMNETTIKLELEKIPKNNTFKFTKMPAKNNDTKLSAKKIKKHTKLINNKMRIMKDVPLVYIIYCYKQILNFLNDNLSCTIAFNKLTRPEYEFMMNVKQIVKHRELLESELPEELNLILEGISTHKDYAFTFLPNKPKCGQKYVIIMKMPKGGVRGNIQPTNDSLNTSRRFYNSPETRDFKKQPTETNNNKILYRKIDNTIKNTNKSNDSNLDHHSPGENQTGKEVNNNLISSSNLYPTQTKSGRCMIRRANSLTSCNVDNKSRSSGDLKTTDSCENVNISYWVQHAPAEYVTISNESMLAYEPKGIQLGRGGVEGLHEENPNNKEKPNNLRGRSWSRDRDVNQMKSKMYEALSVPLSSTKAMRMMQLMGWKGGALGTRGEGIIEPIMPAIGIQTGAGLGHGSNHFKTNVIAKRETQPVLNQPEKMPKQDKASIKAKKTLKQNYTVIAGEETRLKILTRILEFIQSIETKMVLCFDEILQEEETRFVICSIDRFNRRKYVRNLKSQYGADDLRKVQEAMLAKPHVNLAANISEDKKDIVLTKIFKGENNNDFGLDFALDSNDSIRLNVSVFRYIKSMKPKETYGIFTKPSYQLLGYKLSLLEEILKFMDKRESTLLLYIDIFLHDKHTDFLQNFVNVINMGRKPRYATEAEEILVEKIFNKIGDYCLILDYFKQLKIIKLQKRNRDTRFSETCETKTLANESEQTEVKNVLKEKQNNDNINQLHLIEFNIEKPFEKITTTIEKSVDNSISDTSATSSSAHTSEESIAANSLSNTNTNKVKDEQNRDIITIDQKDEVQHTTTPVFTEHTQNKLEHNINIDRKDVDENIEVKEDLSESKDLLQIIDDLEHSIKLEEKSVDEELNHKRNRLYSNDSQLQNTKKIKRHSIKCYKQIQIIPNNDIETMNVNLAGIVQSLISNAIDDTDSLPLLQCSGIVGDKLLYICYNENTYSWLKKVLNDQFDVLDMEEIFEDRRKLKINVKSYIYDDTTKILNRIKLYNTYLDVGSWKICKTYVSVDSTLLWVEVDEEDYNFISRNDFSLFAGIDKATFSVTWDSIETLL